MPTVAYLCATDPRNIYTFSGIHYSMLNALEAAGAKVPLIGHARVHDSWLAAKIRRLGLPTKHDRYDAGEHLKEMEADLENSGADVVIAPIASHFVERWQNATPIVHVSDATPHRLRGYYDQNPQPPTDADRAEDESHGRALRNAGACIFASAWAAESAVEHYGVDPSRVYVVPFGANIQRGLSSHDIEQRTLQGPLRLLFIGKDWQRKGGPIAVEAVEQLNQRGIEAVLHVVGSEPGGTLPDSVKVEGFLSKRKRGERARLHSLLRDSHLFILPTRAECFGVAYTEAAAYGLPALATRTGGVPSVVLDQQTGRLLNPDAPAEDWADAAADLWSHPDRWQKLAIAARHHYEKHLTWAAWARATLQVLKQTAARAAAPDQEPPPLASSYARVVAGDGGYPVADEPVQA